MKITKSQACQILGVSEGASIDEIRSNYKHLARKWHPDKQHGNHASEESTKKFQEVSAAYKKLTTNETDFDEDRMTLAEMMELYKQLFSFGNPMGGMNHCNCPHHHPPYFRYNDELSDYDDYDYTDDDDSDEEFWESIASRLRNKYEARKYMPKDSKDIPHSSITEEEALKNAQELIEEEEIEKRRKEKKKAKKKKKKEKRKQKDKEPEKQVNGSKNDDKEHSKIENQGRDEKRPIEHSYLPNGHAPPQMKTESKNKSNAKNLKKYEEYIEKVHKPVKIVQEDIRPSMSIESKEEKDVKHGKDPRSAKNITGSDEEDQFDANSAFFARAASKAPSVQHNTILPQQVSNEKPIEGKPTKKEKSKQNGPQKSKEVKKTNSKLKDPKEEEEVMNENGDADKNISGTIPEENNKEKQNINTNSDSIIIRSRQLAVRGNAFAAKEQYMDAIAMFSEAIKLDPSDYRFFGNRSYCYDRTGQYENALKDSQSAISLAPQWPKGYFRKGRALTGLERYQEAEESFHNVLTLDKDCPDAQFELEKVRVRILTDMGFQKPFAEESVKLHGTVQSALEALLAGNVTPRSDDGEDDCSIVEECGKRPSVSPSENRTPVIVATAATSQSKIKQKCTALWVGNVNSHVVTEKLLNQLFSKYGKLVSVRLLPERYCAFINYHASEDAANALDKLQGYELSGQNLLIRYPNNPPPGSVVIQNADRATTSTTNKKPVEKNIAASKITGPVNGNECYFWRTTGCVFDSHCRYLHIDDHKGVDLAKVRAKYGTHL